MCVRVGSVHIVCNGGKRGEVCMCVRVGGMHCDKVRPCELSAHKFVIKGKHSFQVRSKDEARGMRCDKVRPWETLAFFSFLFFFCLSSSGFTLSHWLRTHLGGYTGWLVGPRSSPPLSLQHWEWKRVTTPTYFMWVLGTDPRCWGFRGKRFSAWPISSVPGAHPDCKSQRSSLACSLFYLQ